MATSTSLPRYIQISELLIRDIAAGRLLDGERLPPERDLAASLGISVGTLRKSLADLEEKGLLKRVQGSGNYVQQKQDAGSVYAFFRIELLSGGGLPTADILSVDRLTTPPEIPAFEHCEEGHRFRRLRRLDGQPIAVEEIWLDGSRVPTIVAADLSESLYLFYKERLGLWIVRAEDSIGVGAVPDWAEPPFRLSPGTPCGYIERNSWAQDGRLAETSRTWFDNDKARYISRLK